MLRTKLGIGAAAVITALALVATGCQQGDGWPDEEPAAVMEDRRPAPSAVCAAEPLSGRRVRDEGRVTIAKGGLLVVFVVEGRRVAIRGGELVYVGAGRVTACEKLGTAGVLGVRPICLPPGTPVVVDVPRRVEWTSRTSTTRVAIFETARVVVEGAGDESFAWARTGDRRTIVFPGGGEACPSPGPTPSPSGVGSSPSVPGLPA